MPNNAVSRTTNADAAPLSGSSAAAQGRDDITSHQRARCHDAALAPVAEEPFCTAVPGAPNYLHRAAKVRSQGASVVSQHRGVGAVHQ